MSDIDFERSVGYVLHEAAHLMGKRFDQRARALGLTRAQCQVLFYLNRQEGINQARLADSLDIEPISLARLIDRMEQAGWVERRADPADRRARLLYMTYKAKPIFDQVLRVRDEIRAEALVGLSTEEEDQLLDLVLRVRNNLSEKGAVSAEAAALEGVK